MWHSLSQSLVIWSGQLVQDMAHTATAADTTSPTRGHQRNGAEKELNKWPVGSAVAGYLWVREL